MKNLESKFNVLSSKAMDFVRGGADARRTELDHVGAFVSFKNRQDTFKAQDAFHIPFGGSFTPGLVSNTTTTTTGAQP